MSNFPDDRFDTPHAGSTYWNDLWNGLQRVLVDQYVDQKRGTFIQQVMMMQAAFDDGVGWEINMDGGNFYAEALATSAIMILPLRLPPGAYLDKVVAYMYSKTTVGFDGNLIQSIRQFDFDTDVPDTLTLDTEGPSEADTWEAIEFYPGVKATPERQATDGSISYALTFQSETIDDRVGGAEIHYRMDAGQS